MYPSTAFPASKIEKIQIEKTCDWTPRGEKRCKSWKSLDVEYRMKDRENIFIWLLPATAGKLPMNEILSRVWVYIYTIYSKAVSWNSVLTVYRRTKRMCTLWPLFSSCRRVNDGEVRGEYFRYSCEAQYRRETLRSEEGNIVRHGSVNAWLMGTSPSSAWLMSIDHT